MAATWNDARFNWMVIARRLVVRKHASYQDTALAWRAQLEHYRDVLTRWYGGGGGAFTFDAALGQLQGWIDRFFGTSAAPVAAPRAAPGALDLSDRGFHARLWKGPLRVAHEEAGTALAGAPTLDAAKTVTNADAIFRAGDVLELPLHAFLAACGRTAYAGAKFDPEGSYLLSTSVEGADPATAPLHDNAAAMRLQLVVNLGRGAFSATKPVYTKTSSMPAPVVKDDGQEAYARGLVYAATLRGPHVSRMKGSDGWEIEDYHWGDWQESKMEANLPTFTDDHPRFVEDQPLTPGWTCSPFTLFISQYMIGDKANTIFKGGVRTTIEKHAKADSPIRAHYEFTKPAVFVKDPVLDKQVEETSAAIEPLRQRLADAMADLSAEREMAVLAGEGDPAGAKVSADVLKKLKPLASGKKADPKKLHDAVHGYLSPKKASAALPEAEEAALVELHGSWMQRVVAFPTGALPPIKSDGTWGALGQKPPEVSTSGWPAACAAAGCKEKHKGMDKVTKARKALKKALDGLPEGGEDAPGFGGRTSLHGDFNDALGDVNVVIINGHEYAYVKYFPAEELAAAPTLPRSWKLAGYDPLTGTPFAVAGQAPANGQLYLLEASGQLFYNADDKSMHAMTARPWVCTAVTNNRLMLSYTQKDTVQVARKTSKKVWIGEYTSLYGGKGRYLRSHKEFDAIHRMRPGTGAGVGDEYLRSSKYADVKWRRLYLFLKETPVAIMNGWYEDRAVPFPTLEEVAGEYPKVSDVRALNRRIIARIHQSKHPTDKEIKDAHKSAYFHPWAWAWYLDSDVKAPPAPPASTAQPAATGDPAAAAPAATPAP